MMCVATVESTSSSVPVLYFKATTWKGQARYCADRLRLQIAASVVGERYVSECECDSEESDHGVTITEKQSNCQLEHK